MRTILFAALLCAAFPAPALLIRSDRDDAEYLEMATRYPAAVPLAPLDAEGVVIAPRWILTAAHAAKDLKPGTRLTIGGGAYRVKSVHTHPAWTPGDANADIALIFLEGGIRDEIEPARLYRASDEGGRTVVIVGHGANGRIGSPAPRERWDRKPRAAVNTVDRVTPRTLGLRIKPPDEASDLQGAAAAGDDGGPAFIETPQAILVAGIAGAGGDAQWQTYARVSAFVPWIEAVMTDVAKRDLNEMLDAGG